MKVKLIVVLVLVLLVAVVVLQNTADVEARVLFFSTTMPLAFLLLAASLVGFLAGVILTLAAFRKRH